MIMVGIIEGYYVDSSANNSFWFNIRTGETHVYTYSNGGDISECWILFKLNKEQIDKVEERIIKKGK